MSSNSELPVLAVPAEAAPKPPERTTRFELVITASGVVGQAPQPRKVQP